MTQTNMESYPPIFRPKETQNEVNDDMDEADQGVADLDMLPVIDFQKINYEKLNEACKDWGMFRLINHGIPPTLLEKLDDHAKKLFSFSFEFKQASFSNPISYFWGTPGLTPSGAAIPRETGSKGSHQSFSWLEGFHVLLYPLSKCKYEDPMHESFRYLAFISTLITVL